MTNIHAYMRVHVHVKHMRLKTRLQTSSCTGSSQTSFKTGLQTGLYKSDHQSYNPDPKPDWPKPDYVVGNLKPVQTGGLGPNTNMHIKNLKFNSFPIYIGVKT